jgi:hypothetical protein
MSEQSQSFVGTFFDKLKEQSFTIILLVGIMYYQNTIFTKQVEELKKEVDERDKIILDMAKDEKIRLLEREKYLAEQRDKYIEDLYKSLNDRIIEEERK